MSEDDAEEGGGSGPPPSEGPEGLAGNGLDDEVETDRLVFAETHEYLLAFIEAFLADHVLPEESTALHATVVKFATEHTTEQRAIRNKIYPQFVEHLESHPVMGVKIWPRGQPNASVDLLVHKDVRQLAGNQQQAFNLVGMLAFLLTPSARALLRLLGFDYRFIEAAPRRIHIPGSH